MSMLLPTYNTATFSELYESASDFLLDYKSLGIPVTIKDDNVKTLFYLLYARFGNSPVANEDLEQWKYKLFSVIFQYGPTWERKVEIQNILRNLSEEELLISGKAIYNSAFNPDTAPGTAAMEELPFINNQNVSSYKKSKMEAYGLLWSLLSADVTGNFLDKFMPLFKMFVRPENPILYYDGEDE